MRHKSEDTICGQAVVYDTDLPDGEIHLSHYTMALIEARAPSVTQIMQQIEPKETNKA